VAPPIICPGVGDYCGASGFGGQFNVLYHCPVFDQPSSSDELCATGCIQDPTGGHCAPVESVPDMAMTMDMSMGQGILCPSIGRYCGSDVGGIANMLYMCPFAGGLSQGMMACQFGCLSNGNNSSCSQGGSADLLMTKTVDCSQILSCIPTCGTNQQCFMNCYNRGSPTGMSTFAALYGCISPICLTTGSSCDTTSPNFSQASCMNCMNGAFAFQCSSQYMACQQDPPPP
jgi:hypothetical protein